MNIKISEKAQEALNKQIEKNEDNYLRIFIQGFGWGGPRFGIALAKAKDEDKDYFVKVNDINVVVEKDLMDSFKGFSIDYSSGWFNKGFTIIPGLGQSSC